MKCSLFVSWLHRDCQLWWRFCIVGRDGGGVAGAPIRVVLESTTPNNDVNTAHTNLLLLLYKTLNSQIVLKIVSWSGKPCHQQGTGMSIRKIYSHQTIGKMFSKCTQIQRCNTNFLLISNFC